MIQGLRKLLGLDSKKTTAKKSRAIIEREVMEQSYESMNHRERRAADRIALKRWYQDYLSAVDMVKAGKLFRDKERMLKGRKWLTKLLLMAPKSGPGSLVRPKSGKLYLVTRQGWRMLPEL